MIVLLKPSVVLLSFVCLFFQLLGGIKESLTINLDTPFYSFSSVSCQFMYFVDLLLAVHTLGLLYILYHYKISLNLCQGYLFWILLFLILIYQLQISYDECLCIFFHLFSFNDSMSSYLKQFPCRQQQSSLDILENLGILCLLIRVSKPLKFNMIVDTSSFAFTS